jgi:hypothetical protein
VKKVLGDGTSAGAGSATVGWGIVPSEGAPIGTDSVIAAASSSLSTKAFR